MIALHHQQELDNSAIDRELTKLNFVSLEEGAGYDYLLYSEHLERTNPGRLAAYLLKLYSFLDKTGGLWCNGVDPLNDYKPMLWGCFKPDEPRPNPKTGKTIKYEHPPKEATRALYLKPTDRNWQDIADRCGVAITDSDRKHGGFWQWVANHPEIPIITVEGAKKAACLLSQGYAAIGLPSHTGGYRNAKDEFGEKTRERYLIPDLKPFTTGGREFFICFDRDEKQKTIRLVNKSISTTGYLLEQEGCKVRVVKWSEPYKGVDDFVVALGAEAFKSVYDTALTLDRWSAKKYNQLTHVADLEVNQRYLGKLPIPHDADLICIKSPKGTGKTESLIPEVAKAIEANQPVLLIGHRIQLAQDICRRIGINYITEVRKAGSGNLLGYGLCADSLHPKAQVPFIASQWSEALVIIDEAEQVTWHLLNSSTCQSNRVQILHSLRELISGVANSHNGRIILADADLSDLSVDFIRGLANSPNLKQWVCVNNWKPEIGWNVNIYHSFNFKGEESQQPGALMEALNAHVSEGGKPFIVTSGQKVTSQWGTISLEEYFRRMHPYKKVLRIDSESISEPGHSAFGCIAHLNEILPQYDIVIASPSIETGVSIDIKGHFTSVWGIFQGVTPPHSVLQALARLREPVPRYIWARNHATNRIGNGSTSDRSILTGARKVAKKNIALLQEAGLENISADFEFNSIALKTWAKMGARINCGARNYNQNIVDLLVAEGHHVNVLTVPPSPNIDAIKGEIKDCRDTLHQAECEAVEIAEDATDDEYKLLKNKRAKTAAERRIERKHELKKRYTEKAEINVDLIKKDDKGWHPQIRLHYFLTVGRQHLEARDAEKLKSRTRDTSDVFVPDFNKSQLSGPVMALEKMGILEFTNSDTELSNDDQRLVAWAEMIRAERWDVKDAVGVGVGHKDTPIAILQRLLKKLGLGLKCVGRRGSRDDRQRIYKYVEPGDGRNQIFEAWLERDAAAAAELADTIALASAPENSVSTRSNNIYSIPTVDTDHQRQGVDTSHQQSVDTEPEPAMIVACRRFGQKLQFRVEEFINQAQAVVTSLLTRESFTVPVDELSLWEGA